YVTIPRTMDSSILTPVEKLNVLERYFIDVFKQIKAGYNKERGTGKFIGYPIKEYIVNYRKRVPKYDTGKYMRNEPQNVQRYELNEDYFVYDSGIINNTDTHLIDRIAERIDEIDEVYKDVYLIRIDENMRRVSAKNNRVKLHQFGTNYDEVNLAGF